MDKSSLRTYLALHNNSSDKSSIHPDHFNTIFNYTKYSRTLNSHLWKKEIHGTEIPKNVQSIQNKLDSAIDTSKKINDSFIVYSGVKNRKSTMPEHLSNFGEVSFPSYISCSSSPRVANEFAEHDDNGNKHILRIRIPNNFKHGTFIANMSEHPYEKEYLIKNNKSLLIHPNPSIIEHSGTKVHIWNAEIK